MLTKDHFKHLGISLASCLVLFLLLLLYLIYKSDVEFLSNDHLLGFDAKLYEEIKNNGYSHYWLCAFFPAFPMIWKVLGFSAIGISLFNGLLYAVSSGTLSYYYKLTLARQIFFTCIPSIMFMFVPYTEALFFFAGTLLIIGLKNDNILLVIGSLFIGSLIRPTTFVFVPAILGTYLFTSDNFKTGLKSSLLPLLSLLTGLFVTVFIHFTFTQKWFVFFEAQKLWQNYLHFPSLPLTSWGGDGSVRYDGSALAICIFCGIFVLLNIRKKPLVISKDLLFSMLYIAGTALTILAYRNGNLYSLNRFIYATPFIVVVLNYFLSNYIFRWKDLWLTLLITELFWLLFNSYNHIHNFILFTTVSIYFCLLLSAASKNKLIAKASLILLITINLIGLIKVFYRFLNGGWVG